MKGNHCLWLVLKLENHRAPTSECTSFFMQKEPIESNVEAEEARGEGETWIKSGEKETKPWQEQEWLRFLKRRDRSLSSKRLSSLHYWLSLDKLKSSAGSTPFLHPPHGARTHTHTHTPITCTSNKWLFLLTITPYPYLSKPGLNLCEPI